MIKYTNDGAEKWLQTIGGNGDDVINSVVETEDNGLAAGGYFYSKSIRIGEDTIINETNTEEGLLVKYDENGKVVNSLCVGGEATQNIYSLTATEGGFIAGGYSTGKTEIDNNFTLKNKGSMIIECSNQPREIVNIEACFATSLGGSSEEKFCSVAETKDGGYVAGGEFYSKRIQIGDKVLENKGYYDGIVAKYNKLGQLEWINSVASEGQDSITTVIATEDGGCIAGGSYSGEKLTIGEYSIKVDSPGIIIKFDINGNVQWIQNIGSKIEVIEKTKSGGFIVGGRFYSSSLKVGKYTLENKSINSFDGMIIEFDSEDNVKWATSYGGEGEESATTVIETKDGEIIAGGYFESESISIGSYKIDKQGNRNEVLIRFDVNRNVKVAQRTTNDQYNTINTIETLENGKYIVGDDEGNIIEYNEHDEKIGEKSIDNISIITKISGTEDGGYIVGGYGSRYGAIVVKYNNEGKIEWKQKLIESGNNTVYDIEKSSDGTYIIVGMFMNVLNIGDKSLTNTRKFPRCNDYKDISKPWSSRGSRIKYKKL